MKNYCIHNLIDVTVSATVPLCLVDAIAFQLNHFEVDAESVMTSPHRIAVHPYSDWAKYEPSQAHVFHLCRAGDGDWMDDPQSRMACLRDDDGFVVCADDPTFLINMFIQFLLVEQRITLIHAAAVADSDGHVTLLPGPGGVGKTALLGELVQRHGYRLLGDDIVALGDDGTCLSFPRSFVLKRYHEDVYPRLFEKLGITTEHGKKKPARNTCKNMLNILADNIPCKGILRWALGKAGYLKSIQTQLAPTSTPPYLATVPVTDVFGGNSVVDRGMVRDIVFMERVEQSRFVDQIMTKQSMRKRLYAIIHHEWFAHMRHFWTMGSVELVDLPRYGENVSTILRKAIHESSCKRMLIPMNASPADLLKAFRELKRTSTCSKRKAA